MKKYFICLNFFLCSYMIVPVCNAANRQRLLMDYNWKFIQMDVQGAENPAFDDSRWRTLNLPHDWSIEGEFKEDAPAKGAGGFLPTGTGWYRKHLMISSIQKDRQFRIEFEGVYMNSDVWINGQHLGNNPNGYTGFYYNLTPYLKKGENIIAVKVDNSMQPNSRWYSGSGIYRHVWLNISASVHVAQWGTYITTPSVDSAGATINLRTTIENSLPKTKTVTLRSIIKNSAGKEVAVIESQVILSPSSKTEQEQMLRIDKPILWSIENPSLYSMQTLILEGNKIIDNYITPFGVRKIEFDKDKGFLLNGKHVKMNGVCLHHDAGCLGAAVPEQAWERRLQILKQMGCNAIRTSHNPVAPEFLDLCDKLGFLVMDEIYDEWEAAKGQIDYGYHVYFKDHYQTDMISFIHRDRNHPSVVIWSAGNEIPEQGQDNGTEVLRKLVDIFHKEDPTRPVTVANDHIGDAVYPAKPAFLELQDIVGYNYVDRWLNRRELFYSIDRHDHPDWKMIGTENTSISGIRGKYNFKPDQNQMSGRSYRTTMIRPEQLWKFTSLYDYVIGDFMWTGIDYLGESRWPGKNSSSGVIDMCGFPKDAFYFYKSQWNKSELMVHVFPHWNWSGYEGQVVSVYAYTNCDSVELFLNGKSFGIKCVVFPQQGNSGGWNKYAAPFVNQTTSDLHASWDVPYEPGILKVIGRKNGQVVTEIIQTTGKPAAIRLSADRIRINADAHDISNIRVEVVDDNGLVVPDAENLIQFRVEGEGTLAGTDNGNPQDLTPMKSDKRKVFNGLGLAVVRSTLKAGSVKIIATSGNLKGAEITLTSGDINAFAGSTESLK